MKVLSFLALLLSACAPSTIHPPTEANPGSQLVFYTSEPGKFQVWLPASDSVQQYSVTRTLFGAAVDCPSFNFRLNGAYASVQYCDPDPEKLASLSPDQILEQASGSLMKDLRVKFDSRQRLLVQDTYPALELSGPIDMRGLGDDGTFKARLILVEPRIYLILMSVYKEDWCHCRDQTDQVVESLYIEPALSIPFQPTP